MLGRSSCVETASWQETVGPWWKFHPGYTHGVARNRCSNTLRLKIYWDWARDTGCLTVRPGQQLHSKKAGFRAEFNRAETC